MIRIFHDTKFDFIKWWRTAAIATVVFILLGFGSLAVTGGVHYSIEFTGGTLVQLKFAQPPNAAELRALLPSGAEIQQFGDNTEYTVKAQNLSEETSASGGVAGVIRTLLTQKYGADAFQVVRTEAVSARVGEELQTGAAIAMILASLVTLMYLAFRFEWRFGVAAVLSTAHDVLVTLSFIKLFDIEVSLVVVGGILTLLGYSGNDTIIIFDRVRENLKKARREPLYDTLNRSINETLPRSVLTHTTTLAATLALLIFAGEVLRPFAWVMTFGVFVATFSSIYVASPILLWIERKFPRLSTDKAHATRQSAMAEGTSDKVAASPMPRPRARPRAAG